MTDIFNGPEYALRLLRLSQEDPLAFADELERMAQRLLDTAKDVRKSVADSNPYSSEGGMGTRVMANVIGPDGTVKKSINTRS